MGFIECNDGMLSEGVKGDFWVEIGLTYRNHISSRSRSKSMEIGGEGDFFENKEKSCCGD